MTNDSFPPWVKYRSGQYAKPGDIIGYSLNTYRDGEVTGSKVVLKGIVTAVYQNSIRGRWRLEVLWPVHDRVRASVYFGNYKWVYAHMVQLLMRTTDDEKR